MRHLIFLLVWQYRDYLELIPYFLLLYFENFEKLLTVSDGFEFYLYSSNNEVA